MYTEIIFTPIYRKFYKEHLFFFSKLRHDVKASKYKDSGKRLHVHTWRIQSTLYLFVTICVTGNNLMSLTIQHQPSSSLCSYGNHTGIWVKATAVGWVLLDKKNLKLILKLHFYCLLPGTCIDIFLVEKLSKQQCISNDISISLDATDKQLEKYFSYSNPMNLFFLVFSDKCNKTFKLTDI